MSKKINCKFDIQVADGPQMSGTQVVEVEAYDLVEVTIPAGTTAAKTVMTQPGGAGTVQVLLIKSNEYGDKLVYSLDGGADAVPLDGPQLFVGKSADKLLRVPPKEFKLKNEMTKDATVTILIGRNAIS